MKKILLTVIFCCCLCASTTISIMASSLKNDSEISVFRGEECGNCGQSSVRYGTWYSNWVKRGTVNCTHGYSGQDVKKTRYEYEGYICSNCGTKVKVSSTLQIIYEHIG
ncbi:MAG: hypothetical protein MR936_03770 [Eubacterium sp.]|nr:hypothetical protein [Eubacterium sp.]